MYRQINDITRLDIAPVVGAVTNQEISYHFLPTARGSLNIRVDVEVTGVTQVGTLTIKLMGRSPNGTYAALASTNSSKTFTANGTVSLVMNVQNTTDYVDMPLPTRIKVYINTTNAADRVTVSKVYVTQANG